MITEMAQLFGTTFSEAVGKIGFLKTFLFFLEK